MLGTAHWTRPFHSVEGCRHTHKRKNGLKQVPLGLRGGILVCQSQGTSPDAAWVKVTEKDACCCGLPEETKEVITEYCFLSLGFWKCSLLLLAEF